jgi:hypothetical protein
VVLPSSVNISGTTTKVATGTSYTWSAGTSIGYFIIANGWIINGNNTYSLNTGATIWYSIANLNTGHYRMWSTVASPVEAPNTITACVEDTDLGTADKDYDDLVYQIKLQ